MWRLCDGPIDGDFTYNCRACDFYLHVPCALQILAYLERGATETIEIPVMDYYWVQPTTKRKWTLVHAPGRFSRCCHSCGKHCQGLTHRFVGFWFHKSCVEVLCFGTFHHKHPIVFVYQDLICKDRCNVCREKIKENFFYNCKECDRFKLHPYCVRMPTLNHPLHEHDLYYFQRNLGSNSLCRACGKICAVDFYCCVSCRVHIHNDCLQTLQTIQSKHHIDELTLYESIVEDDSGEYHCDICERTRNPELRAYYCKVCELIAHVACTASPVKLKPEFEELDEEIEGVRREMVAKEKNVRRMTANLEQEKAKLKELTEKLEALKQEKDELMKY